MYISNNLPFQSKSSWKSCQKHLHDIQYRASQKAANCSALSNNDVMSHLYFLENRIKISMVIE